MKTLTEAKNLINERTDILSQINALSGNLNQVRGKLTSSMDSLVPKDIKIIISNEAIVETLITHGMIHSWIPLGEYGIKTQKDAEDVIKKLLTAWKGLVKLDGKMDFTKSHRVSYKMKLK